MNTRETMTAGDWETRNIASPSISTSPTSTGATVVSWEMRDGDWGLETKVDVDPSITSETGRRFRHQKYWSASVLLSSDGWRWAGSVRGASAVQAEIHPVSVWCERLRGYQVEKNIWTVGCLQITFAALTLCSQFSVFLLKLGFIHC